MQYVLCLILTINFREMVKVFIFFCVCCSSKKKILSHDHKVPIILVFQLSVLVVDRHIESCAAWAIAYRQEHRQRYDSVTL